MVVKNQKNSTWKESLPLNFSWLENLPCTVTAAPKSGAHHVVLLEIDKKNPDTVNVDSALLDEKLKKKLSEAAASLGIKASSGSFMLSHESTPYIFVPVSQLNVSEKQKGSQAGIDAAAFCKTLKIEDLVLCSGKNISSLDMLEGLAQGFYKLQAFKGKAEQKKSAYPEKVYLLDKNASAEQIKTSIALAQAMSFSRQLGDAPSNWLNPEKFAELAKEMSSELGLKCSVKGRSDLEELGYGSFISVANGSKMGPRLITIEIEGEQTDKTVALVGKGLTFDTGGVCLKPAGGLEEMKYDMCGGGSVLASAYFLGKVKPPVNVVCLIGAVENLIGEGATRPGDVVKAGNGKTIEVINTDAEGRLVLADVLHHANTWKPELIIDVATLTGAVLMSLGSCGSAIMSNKKEASDYVLKVGKQVGEPLWELPMWPELKQEMKSDVADLKNIPAPNVKAGTVTAGIFLAEFVGNTPWVHIDIAGTAWNCKTTGYPSRGGSGFIVKTLTRACLSFEKLIK